MIAHDQMLVQK